MVDEVRNERRAEAPASSGVEWDGATWVDVDGHGRWSPDRGLRARAAIVLGLVIGTLLLLAGFASVDDGDGRDRDPVAATTTVATDLVEPTTTTEADAAPESVNGLAPPPECEDDDRDAEPLRFPASMQILVLNSADVRGHATAWSTTYREAGYQTLPPVDGPSGADTSVTYQAGFCAEAVVAAEVLGRDDVEIGPVVTSSRGANPAANLVITLAADTVDD